MGSEAEDDGLDVLTRRPAAVNPDANDALLPLAMSQREVWLDHCAWPGSAHLNIGGGCLLAGPLDLALLRRALRALVAESEALRLVPQPDGSQRLLAAYEPPLEEADLSHGPDPRQAIRDWGAQRIRAPYELGTTPPWRFALLKGGPELHGVTILFHHTIMDGWGTTLVLRRWAEHYNALAGSAELPPRGADYRQFIEDSAKYQAGPGYARDGDYWLRQLEQPPEPLIERRYHGAAAASGNGLPAAQLLSHGMEADRYAQLAAAVAARGQTPFTCFLAGLALYLSRTAGRSDLLIGVPCLNRLGQRFRQTPGMFVGVMPLRIRIEPGMTAGALLAHVAHQLGEGLRHARYPLSELGRQLQLMRLGRDSLLEVMLSFERQDYDLHYGSARLTDPYQLFNGWARYPLAITVCEFAADDAELARDPALVVEASAACYSADEAALLAQRLWWTTQQLALGDAERDLDAIAVMPPAESAALVVGLHKDLAQQASPQTFVEQFEQQAALRPQATALVWDEGRLSYAELNRRADRLATALHAAGAAPERIVATALPRSPELVVALLAIAKSGAAFLPMNPEAPPTRLREILQDSRALALLLPQVTDAALSELHPLVLRVRPVKQPHLAAGEATPQPSDTPAWRRAAPHELAYVLYTSGSTGGAKGVLMPHASLSRRLSWLARAWGIDSRDRAAQTTQPSFDPALVELLLPLTVGASVALPPPGRLHPRRLAEFILRHGATFCALVPSTLAGLLSGLHGREGLKLRVACCGGEVLPAELANRFIAETGARLYNVYGPTEAAIFATAWPCVTSAADTALPLGRPLDDTRIYVLDAALRPQPFGVAGEIFIGGGGLARGYLGRPELDRNAFLPDPFQAGERMYRTGDRGWLDAQGLLHFAGRADRQIKLRGYRIEPGDIELACLAVPGVEQAYVEKIESSGAPRLHAWIGNPHGGLTVATLLAALRERLPDYMLPSGATLMPSLPLTATGKIDARALPAPQAAAGVAGGAPRQVLSALEQQLTTLWQQALKRPAIRPQENFFDLGGDSLAALEILGAMEETLGRSLSLQLISQHPTIEELALALGRPQPLPGMIQQLGTGCAATPLYLCASGYGDVLRFQTLARALHGLLDVHMLQPPRDVQQAACRTPRELAERYADCIASRGLAPGWLAGFSVGGVGALETTRVLQERGQPPLGLLLLDTIHPDAVLGGTSSWRTLGWLVHRLHVEDLSMNGRRLGAMFSDPGLVSQVMALRGYRSSTISGPTLLVKSSGLAGWGGLFFRAWHRLLPQLQTAEVSGLHGSIFEAARVGELARTIQQFTLARAVISGEKG